VKVGDLVKWRPMTQLHVEGPSAKPRFCVVTSVDDRYVTLTGFPQNQVFQRPDDFIIEGVRRPSPLELISESR
jgi:hypothetical protein